MKKVNNNLPNSFNPNTHLKRNTEQLKATTPPYRNHTIVKLRLIEEPIFQQH